MISELMSQKYCNEMAAVVRISLKSKDNGRDVPGGPAVKNLPCDAEDTGVNPAQGTEAPFAQEQLGPLLQLHPGAQTLQPRSPCSAMKEPA